MAGRFPVYTDADINSNPASDLELPKLGRRLPKHVLTVSEAETVLAQPDITKRLGLRDRALLETLYSTAIRRKELVTSPSTTSTRSAAR